MAAQRMGIVHPGEMGISIAAAAQGAGSAVAWASDGRSARTRERAARFHLEDAGTVANLCATCSLIVSVCPPHAAETVAQQVLANGFAGLYLDANAIAPQRAAQMARALGAGGAAFVDGGIIGGPAWTSGATRLYLSGPRAADVAACFAGGPLDAIVLGAEVGQASALKMCYAAYSKGTTALLATILAAAEHLGVRQELYREWALDEAGFVAQAERRVRRSTAKAWRFEGEMDEIAATFSAAGLPGGFHTAAASIFHRLAQFKDAPEMPALEAVLTALRAPQDVPRP